MERSEAHRPLRPLDLSLEQRERALGGVAPAGTHVGLDQVGCARHGHVHRKPPSVVSEAIVLAGA
jgi:hypothetical protein